MRSNFLSLQSLPEMIPLRCLGHTSKLFSFSHELGQNFIVLLFYLETQHKSRNPSSCFKPNTYFASFLVFYKLETMHQCKHVFLQQLGLRGWCLSVVLELMHDPSGRAQKAHSKHRKGKERLLYKNIKTNDVVVVKTDLHKLTIIFNTYFRPLYYMSPKCLLLSLLWP